MRRAEMLRLDRNQHPSTLSTPLILHNSNSDQHQILSWSAISRDSVHKDKDKSAPPQNLETSPTSTLTPPPENPSSPFPNQDDHDRSAESKMENASRQSTPLSELSSPSPSVHVGSPQFEKGDNAKEESIQDASAGHGDREVITKKDGHSTNTDTHTSLPTKKAPFTDNPSSSTDSSSAPTEVKHSSTAPTNTSIQKARASSTEGSFFQSTEPVAPALSPLDAPQLSATASLSTNKLDTKVVTILELNAELLKTAMEFQSRGIPMSDPRFNQFSTRMQSNLAWMAAAADANRETMNMALPVMQPPTSVDFLSMDRIYQLYATLPTIFANDITRRSQSAGTSGGSVARSVSPTISLKRDRNDETPLDLGSKRRDTGENKNTSLPSALLHSNHAPLPNIAPSVSPPATMQQGQHLPISSMPPPSQIPIMSPSSSDPRHQNQPMRPAPPPHQPPPSLQSNLQRTPPPTGIHPDISVPVLSNIPGPSNAAVNGNPSQVAGLSALGPLAVQYYNLLQNPSHPMVQYLVNSVPGFQSMPVQTQIMKLHQIQTAVQSRNQQQLAAQRMGQQGTGIPQQINQFPNPNASMTSMNATSSSQQSPVSAQSPQNQQSFSNTGSNTSMDVRIGGQNAAPHQQTNLNNHSANQRQLMMMQQLRTNGINNGAVNAAMLNSQIAAAQGRMRPEQQHRISPGAGSPSHSQSPLGGSGMEGSQYPMMRSNPPVQGIARSGMSPTDGSSMQARIPSGSQPNSEDVQRAILAQQQRNLMSQNNTSSYISPQQMFSGANSNWQQQSGGGMGGQPQGYRMSPSPNTGVQGSGYGVSSPNPQQWGGQGGGNNLQYFYNAVQSPSGERASATPTPSQQISQGTIPTMDPLSSSLGDFDLFHWG